MKDGGIGALGDEIVREVTRTELASHLRESGNSCVRAMIGMTTSGEV